MSRRVRFLILILAAFVIFLPAISRAFTAADEPAVGTYFGVVQGESFDTSGYARVVIGRGGLGSVAVKLGDEKTCVVLVGEFPGGGIFGPGGPFMIIPISLNPVMDVRLTAVVLPDGSSALTGTITEDDETVDVTLTKTAPPKDPPAGQYTVLFENDATDGNIKAGVAGSGILKVGANGKVTFTGTLADGSVIKQITTLNAAGDWQLYAKARQGALVVGQIHFADNVQTDCSGDVSWHIPAITAHGDVPAVPERNLVMSLAGSRYHASQGWGGIPAWTLDTSDDGNETISFSTTLEPNGPLLLTNRTAPAGVFLNPATGQVIGGYRTPTEVHFMQGVLFQKTGSAFGLTQETPGFPALSTFNWLKTMGRHLPGSKKQFDRVLGFLLSKMSKGDTGTFAIHPPAVVAATALTESNLVQTEVGSLAAPSGIVVSTDASVSSDGEGFSLRSNNPESFSGTLNLGSGLTKPEVTSTYSDGVAANVSAQNVSEAPTSPLVLTFNDPSAILTVVGPPTVILSYPNVSTSDSVGATLETLSLTSPAVLALTYPNNSSSTVTVEGAGTITISGNGAISADTTGTLTINSDSTLTLPLFNSSPSNAIVISSDVIWNTSEPVTLSVADGASFLSSTEISTTTQSDPPLEFTWPGKTRSILLGGKQ